MNARREPQDLRAKSKFIFQGTVDQWGLQRFPAYRRCSWFFSDVAGGARNTPRDFDAPGSQIAIRLIQIEMAKDALVDSLSVPSQLDKAVVFRVATDPEPDNCAFLHRTQIPITEPYTHRVDVLLASQLFELKPWVAWICLKEPECALCFRFGVERQVTEQTPELPRRSRSH
jgi:hypothetical protein